MLLRHIRYFLAVAEHANFSRAADALHVSQPALSQQIRQLEDNLGVQLFDRSGRAVRLTDAGAAYQHYAKKAIADLETGRRALLDVKDMKRGLVRIGMTPTFMAYLLPLLIEQFHKQYPDIELSILELSQEQTESCLIDDALDLGIAFPPSRSDEILAHPLMTEALSLTTCPSHFLHQSGGTIGIADLKNVRFAVLSKDFVTRKFFDQYCTASGLRPRVAIELNSIGAIVQVIKHTELVTVLPEAITRVDTGLKALAVNPALPTRPVCLLRRREAFLSVAAAAFIDMTENIAKSRFG